MIKLKFELNFHLPVVEDITFISSFQDFATFKYRFVEVKRKTNVKGFEDVSCTTILMEYIPEMSWQDDLLDPKGAFYNCFIFLNNFIDAYRLKSGFEYIKNFTIPELPPYLIMEIEGSDTLYVLPHFSHMTKKVETTVDMIGKTLSQLDLWRLHRPLEVIDKFLSKAVHHIYNEEFVFGIVELQTSFESYIRMCHHLILEKDGIDAEEIEKKMSIPLKNVIEQHISKGLKEDLKIANNQIIGRWYNTLYKIRNQIVHSGLSYISGDEAYSAFDAYQEAINYISDLLVREKMISSDKMIQISDLNKNIPENQDYEAFIDIVKNRGLDSFLNDDCLDTETEA